MNYNNFIEFNPFMPEFAIVIFIDYNPWILDL